MLLAMIEKRKLLSTIRAVRERFYDTNDYPDAMIPYYVVKYDHAHTVKVTYVTDPGSVDEDGKTCTKGE